ncbi:MAG: SPOR domain-containing protein [Neisseriaceae bacterium]|nr:SPOR domain-containing protein [Neisseriaceae bacterium]
MNKQQEEYEKIRVAGRHRLIGVIVFSAIALILALIFSGNKQDEKTSKQPVQPNVNISPIGKKETAPPPPQTQPTVVETAPVEVATETAPKNQEADVLAPTLPNDMNKIEETQSQPADSNKEINIPIQTDVIPPQPVEEHKPDDVPQVTEKSKQTETKKTTTAKNTPVVNKNKDNKQSAKNTQTAPVVSKSTSNKSGAIIQAGAFMNASQAESQRARLAQIGIPAQTVRASTAKGDVYRVRIGPMPSQDAQQTLNKLRSHGFDGIMVGN